MKLGLADLTYYLDIFETVAVESKLRRRCYEVEIDPDLMKLLSEQAQKRGIAVSQLVSNMLREKVRPAV
ncbi:MAG: hypothetical protein H0V27_07190 [Pyrinomonadaceae bacterium]|nr:hypothetical protein [Pyrinomonadaceae bacterium]